MAWVSHGSGYNTSAVTGGADWTDVCSCQIIMSADKVLLDAWWIATAGISAGSFRFEVDGTPVANPADSNIDLVAPAPVGEHARVLMAEIEITTATTHTFKLQCKKGGVLLSTLDIDAGMAHIRAQRVSS